MEIKVVILPESKGLCLLPYCISQTINNMTEEVRLAGMFTVLLTALIRLSHSASPASHGKRSLCHTPFSATVAFDC